MTWPFAVKPFASLELGLHQSEVTPVGPHRQLVLHDQLQELRVAQAVAGGLLKPHLQALQEPREAQLLQRSTQGVVHVRISFGNASCTNRSYSDSGRIMGCSLINGIVSCSGASRSIRARTVRRWYAP